MQYNKDESRNPITDSNSFKFKARFLAASNNDGVINAEIAVPLKYLSNFKRTLEMPLINYEINLTLTWSANCVISEVDRLTTFTKIDTKLYISVVTL